jgi:hypothetical protein
MALIVPGPSKYVPAFDFVVATRANLGMVAKGDEPWRPVLFLRGDKLASEAAPLLVQRVGTVFDKPQWRA